MRVDSLKIESSGPSFCMLIQIVYQSHIPAGHGMSGNALDLGISSWKIKHSIIHANPIITAPQYAAVKNPVLQTQSSNRLQEAQSRLIASDIPSNTDSSAKGFNWLPPLTPA